jgi:hypothetical protein
VDNLLSQTKPINTIILDFFNIHRSTVSHILAARGVDMLIITNWNQTGDNEAAANII